MCEALKELFADDFKESELKGRNEGRTEGAASKIIELVIKKHQKGDPIPSMRSLAKSIHVNVITVQGHMRTCKEMDLLKQLLGGEVLYLHRIRILSKRKNKSK